MTPANVKVAQLLQELEKSTEPTARTSGRISRWEQNRTKSFIPGVPHFIPPATPEDCLEALILRIRIEEITHKLATGNLDIEPDRTRSPSPPPVYDAQGKRTNTRELRIREKFQKERQKLIEKSLKLNPLFKPPADYKPIPTKKIKKIPIPVDEYPDYNFMGTLIGPRGLTQKAMEKESGAKIAVRGKGSAKDARPFPGEDEPLHVLITADTDAQMQKALELVMVHLNPNLDPEGKEQEKRIQLRRLAEINGTLRDKVGWGHNPDGPQYKASVNCGICGEPSHPTSDCPMQGAGSAKPPFSGSRKDSEYESFLAEIQGASGGHVKPQSHLSVEKSYEEFMKAISETSGGKKPNQTDSWENMGESGAPPPWGAGPPVFFPGAPPPWMGYPPGHGGRYPPPSGWPPASAPSGFPPHSGFPPSRQQFLPGPPGTSESSSLPSPSQPLSTQSPGGYPSPYGGGYGGSQVPTPGTFPTSYPGYPGFAGFPQSQFPTNYPPNYTPSGYSGYPSAGFPPQSSSSAPNTKVEDEYNKFMNEMQF